MIFMWLKHPYKCRTRIPKGSKVWKAPLSPPQELLVLIQLLCKLFSGFLELMHQYKGEYLAFYVNSYEASYIGFVKIFIPLFFICKTSKVFKSTLSDGIYQYNSLAYFWFIIINYKNLSNTSIFIISFHKINI